MTSVEDIHTRTTAITNELPLGEVRESMWHAQDAAERIGTLVAEGALGLRDVESYLGTALGHAAEASNLLQTGYDALVDYSISIAAQPQRIPSLDIHMADGNTLTIEDAIVTPFKAGGAEVKQLLEGDVDGEPASVVTRPQDPDYIPTWEAFRAAGLPVVPEVGETPDGTVVMTDLKAEGSEIYGKGLFFQLNTDDERVRPQPEIDAHFLHLTSPLHIWSLRAQVRHYVRQASEAGIQLPMDDAFELLVHPDGSWELIIVDLYFARVHNLSTLTDIQKKDLAGKNQEYADDFLEHLANIRRLLRRH